MKTLKLNIVSIATLIILTGCAVYRQDLNITTCPTAEVNASYSKASTVEGLVREIVKKGVPGMTVAMYSREGLWQYAAGDAKIENHTPMQTCHLHYLQSIAKTYMAVAILKLYEEQKLNLDAPMTTYLPLTYSQYITDAEQVTIRMLLNHTSGVPEYNSEPAYITDLLQTPDHTFTPEDYLAYIEGKPLRFSPGTKYSYCNTNYELLALIGDAITGDHAAYITENIFTPLALNHTYYRNEAGYLNYPELYNAYWDRHSDGIIENASQLQRNNVAALIGDDGIVATPEDAILFLKGLMEGLILSSATLDTMKTWALDSKGNPAYGLGLDHATFGDHIAYGHSGGGIGAGCQLYYFPEQQIYLFLGINLGTVTDSPIHKEVGEILENLYKVILE